MVGSRDIAAGVGQCARDGSGARTGRDAAVWDPEIGPLGRRKRREPYAQPPATPVGLLRWFACAVTGWEQAAPVAHSTPP